MPAGLRKVGGRVSPSGTIFMSLIDRIRGLWGGDSADPAARQPDSDASTPVAVIDLDDGHAAWKAGVQFIDVREDDEWAAGHIAGAAHRPVGELSARPTLDSARDTPVVTYCAAGARAARAGAVLAAAGYTDVSALASGYGDWQARGYPVEQPGPQDNT